MIFSTADFCDAYSERVNLQIAEPIFQHYGTNTAFCGQITTLKVFEDSQMIRSVLEEKVKDRVLVIDGGGSRRCALVDHRMAAVAAENGWEGMIIYGCIRDAARLARLPIGIRALHAHPLKCHNKDHGVRDHAVNFSGVLFKKDHFLYADADGIIVSETRLS
ncbi:MAG: ribonuclease E activity regulator RraA [Gammaproteobacteria bacterium]